MRLAEDGMYPIVTHAFNFASKGALGMLQGRRWRSGGDR